METLVKIILTFGCILFLVSNSKAGMLENDGVIVNGDSFLSKPQYNLTLPVQKDDCTIRICF